MKWNKGDRVLYCIREGEHRNNDHYYLGFSDNPRIEWTIRKFINEIEKDSLKGKNKFDS